MFMEMCGNGVQTGTTKRIIEAPRVRIRPDLTSEMKEFTEVDVSTDSAPINEPQFAAQWTRIEAAITSDSELS